MNQRRYDLDWLRIFAFGLLILYHVGMFYVTWDWHVKSSRAGPAIEPLMRLLNPWRLSLLFLIAGAATRFLLDKAPGTGALLRSRALRLGLPLLLGMFVIVPPQSYYEVVEAVRSLPADVQAMWMQDFYLKYVTASGHWCDADGCLLTPTYNHLWFVAYLLAYTVVLVPLLPLLRRTGGRWGSLFEGPWVVIVPWLAMFLLRATLAPRFGQTHLIWNDWYLHTVYFGMFLFGFAIAHRDRFFQQCERLRWMCLVVALAAWATLEINLHLRGVVAMSPGNPLRLLGTAVRELQAWMAILALIGFAHRHLRAVDNRARRVLTGAIFPFYLIHQTLIVVGGHYLDAWQLPVVLEAAMLLGCTAAGCWLFYELGQRVAVLRPWIGLGPLGLRDAGGIQGPPARGSQLSSQSL